MKLKKKHLAVLVIGAVLLVSGGLVPLVVAGWSDTQGGNLYASASFYTNDNMTKCDVQVIDVYTTYPVGAAINYVSVNPGWRACPLYDPFGTVLGNPEPVCNGEWVLNDMSIKAAINSAYSPFCSDCIMGLSSGGTCDGYIYCLRGSCYTCEGDVSEPPAIDPPSGFASILGQIASLFSDLWQMIRNLFGL
jgi:hypothetical protein